MTSTVEVRPDNFYAFLTQTFAGAGEPSRSRQERSSHRVFGLDRTTVTLSEGSWQMSGQALVIGFGVTGASAAQYLLDHDTDPTDLIVVDIHREAVERAAELGAHVVLGDGTNRHVLRQAISGHVRHVVVAVVPDDAAVLVTMLARDLCPTATIATAVRNLAHVPFVRRHGADHVVTTSESTGTALVHALQDQPGPASAPSSMPSALPLTMPWTVDPRPVQATEIGHELHDCAPTAIGVLRGNQRYWGAQAARLRLTTGDQIVVLQSPNSAGHTGHTRT